MAQAYLSASTDTRTFDNLITRVVSELHRPDLISKIPEFIRDAIRYYSRQPFFFNELDNTGITAWVASLYAPYGYTIVDTASDGNTYIFVSLTSGTVGAVKPSFTPTLFTARTSRPGNIFNAGDAGTTVDGTVTWATVQAWVANTTGAASFTWTQLSTVPTFNQYTPPIDYIAPRLVELTYSGLRIGLDKQSYSYIRSLDVLRPAPVLVYPSDWAWFNQKIYVWPYPISFYPLTLSYYTAPFPPTATATSNFWTTTAEAMIRSFAKGRINEEIIRDPEAASLDFGVADKEFKSFRSQESQQEATGGIPAESW